MSTDTKPLQQRLRMAEQHVARGNELLQHQQDIVDELERDGHDTRQARSLLRTLAETQEMHIVDRNRLRAEIEAEKRNGGRSEQAGRA